ncbi:MAG: hypothetical protein HFE97_03335, partial [Oscillospiraceae bacterium]|nr:hypothetical protein [Oscillospiraceae bacterium]
MRSAISSFKGAWFYPTLYRKNLLRFWPLWALYGLYWLFLFPIGLLTTRPVGDARWYFVSQRIPSATAATSLFMAAGLGILAAMAVFSYLYQGRSVNLLHALPVRREGLFLTNYLSGLTFFALPLAVVFVLTLLIELLMGVVYFPALFTWLVVNLMAALFFYSFAVFCAMFTGHILALPVFYGILNWLVLGLCGLIESILGQFVYGFAGIEGLHTLASWLTPFYHMYQHLGTSYVESTDAYCVIGLLPLFLYAIVGLVLAGLALAIYNQRQLECAGDVVSVAWVRPVFKYGVALCAALALGQFLYYIFFQGTSLEGPWFLLLNMILGGAVGYFVAKMFLAKSFRVFHEGWKGLGVFSLALVAASCCMVFDVTGFEQRVPDVKQVEMVCMDAIHSYPTDSMAWGSDYVLADPEEIALITQLHSTIVSEYSDRGRMDEGYYSSYETEPWSNLDIEVAKTVRVQLEYTLVNGKKMYRSYTVPISQELMDDPRASAGQISAILNNRKLAAEHYFAEINREEAESRLVDVSLSIPDREGEGYRYLDMDE